MAIASPVKNVVLVHGGFVDGSGWQGVYDLLKQDGYKVSVVQNPTLSLEPRLTAIFPADQAAFMADSQVPWGMDAPAGSITDPAWRTKPSWYMITTEDRMIPPPAQHAMSERVGATVVEVTASHSVYLSQPGPVADLIEQASSAVTIL